MKDVQLFESLRGRGYAEIASITQYRLSDSTELRAVLERTLARGWMPPQDAALILDLAIPTAYSLIHAKKIGHRLVGRRIRLELVDLEKFLKTGRVLA